MQHSNSQWLFSPFRRGLCLGSICRHNSTDVAPLPSRDPPLEIYIYIYVYSIDGRKNRWERLIYFLFLSPLIELFPIQAPSHAGLAHTQQKYDLLLHSDRAGCVIMAIYGEYLRFIRMREPYVETSLNRTSRYPWRTIWVYWTTDKNASIIFAALERLGPLHMFPVFKYSSLIKKYI